MLFENVWDEIDKTRLKLLAKHIKAKLLTRFFLTFFKLPVLLQPYLILRKRLRIYFPIYFSYGFPDHLFHSFFFISFAIFYHGSQYLLADYCRY